MNQQQGQQGQSQQIRQQLDQIAQNKNDPNRVQQLVDEAKRQLDQQGGQQSHGR